MVRRTRAPAAGRRRNPAARVEASLGLLAFAQRNALLAGNTSRSPASKAGRAVRPASSPSQRHVYFAQFAAFAHHDAMHGKRIQQFVREDAARREFAAEARRPKTRGLRDVRAERLADAARGARRIAPRPCIAARVEIAAARARRNPECARPAAPCPRRASTTQNSAGRPSSLPHFGKLPRQQPAENRMDVHAGVKIREALRVRAAVIAEFRMVQQLRA